MPRFRRNFFQNSRQRERRMYGFFECSSCSKRWESSHVYCRKGEFEALYGQECKDCHVSCKPYRVERLRCPKCNQQGCSCADSDGSPERHVDLNKGHRSDLCARCKAGKKCTGNRN